MTDLLSKLNYKGQERIAIINAEESFFNSVSETLKEVVIDKKIDPRYPYSFIVLFVKSVSEIDYLAPVALHNLMADGILWFCFPKKSSKKYQVEIDRDHGWKTLNDAGLLGVRNVNIDENWSAIRFRNIRYIKSRQDRRDNRCLP